MVDLHINAPWAYESVVQLLDGVGGHDQEAVFLCGYVISNVKQSRQSDRVGGLFVTEQVWGKFDRTAAFASRPLFPCDNPNRIDYVVTNIQNRPIYSEASLRNFERYTVDNFVEKAIEALKDDERLRHEFGIQGRVTFLIAQTRMEEAEEGERGAARRHRRDGTARRRNRRAGQFCVHLVADGRQIPVYTVESKAPHKVPNPELVAANPEELEQRLQELVREVEQDAEKAELLLSTFFPLLPEIQPEAAQERHQKPRLPQADRLSPEELRAAVMRASPWKAPGRDGLSMGVWQKIWEAISDPVLGIFEGLIRLG
ncbi:hypothetical protein AAWM_07256 [Aspergillus awamori]|uniref:Uncharacterized protein n=1 Tax=Aspergillus awamori TaxID=105351 RepID=A0A401KYQ7_ASPAW|nr:hypothetical protein AAWM_07256 [Aspergillus awamori]